MKLTADFALRFLHFLDTLESFILFLNFFGVVSELKKFLEKFVSCAPTHCNKGNVIVDFRGKERFFVALLCSEATAITKFDRNLSVWIVFAILEICYQMILEQYLAHSTE